MSAIGSDILTSDEEICDSVSSLDGNLTINESMDSSDEIINKMPSNKHRRPRTIISDDDDDEGQMEMRALSPRTRMSITGICPSDLSSDSSDIDYSVHQNNSKRNTHTISACANKSSNTVLDADEQQISNSLIESPAVSSRATNINLPIKEVSLRKSFDHNASGVRYSSVFENSINDQMSSTVRPEKPCDLTSGSEKSNDSDILILSRNESVVNISSDDNASNDEDKQPICRSIIEKKFQPKITAILQETKNTFAKKVVSKDFYDKQVKTLSELRSDLSSAEGLLEKLGPNLYDRGKQLALRVESLKCGVKKKAEEISTFVVENINSVEIEKRKPAVSKEAPNWDELSAAVNDIKPIYTGKQGLNTFNKQKVLTMERLKDLHGSLESCPGENVFADDPKDLKVALMPHQKHALAWMSWREQQKPRGGILADDMGLGKTLTMISMVLAFKTQQANIHESTDSEGDDEKQGWSTKNRKDYYKGGTLVVCPASLMRQWECEVESKVSRHKLSVCVHHGNNRDSRPRHLSSYDLVITTYNIVSREAKSRGALFGINWQRIILDEAHIVRNHKSQSSEGVCELRGKYRWALTGTPIQNKEMDVYALLKFLKCTPFDDLSHWKKWIDNKSAGGQQRLNTLMKSLMLRRTKALLQEQGSLLCLPERVVEVIEVKLDKEEMNVYQKIMTYSKTLFAQFLIQRANKNSDIYSKDPMSTQTKDPSGVYHKIHQKFSKLHHNGNEVKSHQILVLLLRLRQICCHPGLIDAMLEGEDGVFSDSDRDEQEIDLLDQLNKLAITDNDVSQTLHSDEDVEHTAISKASAKVLQKSNPVFNLSRPSSKMNKVLQIVEKQVLNSSDKGIIISQWTSILNILKEHLEGKGIRTLSLNGGIPVKNRQSIVTEFNDPNTKPKILLLSLTAGGVGLNLVGANHLLLIDLHWNPQLEMQAQDRIYRVGQKKKVHIYKFMCKDTVEERIKALQDQKLQIAEGLLTGARTSDGSKLSIEDLKGLFGL